VSGPASSGKAALLDLLATARPISDRRLAQLSPADWESIADSARQHRLGPMLDHRCRTFGVNWPVPAGIRQQWAGSYRAAALRSLKVQQTIRKLADCLNSAGIPFAVLKGGWLAWYAYPEPALRPMRDVDVWVGPQLATRAQDALNAAGFVACAVPGPSLEQALEHEKHLPPLQLPGLGIAVEIHVRTYHVDEHSGLTGCGAGGGEEVPGLLDRMITHPLGDAMIGYLSPSDTLLHLIVHAAYDHRFNNGPVVIDDIACLLASHPVDWPGFWQRAAAHGWTRGCQLTLALAEFQHGPQPVEWPPEGRLQVPDNLRDHALELCLQDFAERGTTAFFAQAREARSPAALAAMIRRRFTASPGDLAGAAGLAEQSRFYWLGYPAWLAARVFKAGRQLSNRAVHDDAARLAGVASWLEADASGPQRKPG
jgi:hypothetical protein